MTQALAALDGGIARQAFFFPASVRHRPVLSANTTYGLGETVSLAALTSDASLRRLSATMASVPTGLRSMTVSSKPSPSRAASIATALSSFVAIIGIVGEVVAGGVAFGGLA